MRSESRLDWFVLTPQTIADCKDKLILAVRADGKGYYGRVMEINAEYVLLANGGQAQYLRFFDSPTQFAVVEVPVRRMPGLAERELFKKGKV